MKVDAIFDDEKFYDINQFDVKPGKKFQLVTDEPQPTKWFVDNDPVLAMNVDASGNTGDFEAGVEGGSTIYMMVGREILKEINIRVVGVITKAAFVMPVSIDPVKLKELEGQIKTSTDELSTAITENTPTT